MTDEELVKQGRAVERDLNNGFPMTCEKGRVIQEMASRIEALTAKHEELYGVFVFWRAEADKLREQLEAARADTKKAVEALRSVDDEYSDLRWGPELSSIKQARATLAEIEGSNAP